MSTDLSKYMMPNGLYDTREIMRDAGLDSYQIMFGSFGGDAEPGSKPLVLPEPFNTMLLAAEAHNEPLVAQRRAAKKLAAETEARAILSKTNRSFGDWKHLQTLGYAVVNSDNNGGYRPELTEAGRALNG